ncbi:MAG: polyphosphate kinase 1 [Peptococcaceae bacterium]|nr:polyphosphate kinase 1 [Peptococcaceae bacterium]
MAVMTSAREAEKTNTSKCMQNRELSWLKFNERVLEEANFSANPPLERLKFISIFCSNLDEFYMIRVGSLTDYLLFAPDYFDNKTGMTAEEQLEAIYNQTSSLFALKDRYFSVVTQDLDHQGLRYIKMNDLPDSECKKVETHFVRNILPLLSPHIIDSRHPFPHMDNKRLYIAVTLGHKNRSVFGLIAIHHTLERIFCPEGSQGYVLMEDIIYHFVHLAFSPYKVNEKTILAVTRNADINTEEDSVMDEDMDYRQFMKKTIKKRQRLAPVRLELQHNISRPFREFLYDKLSLNEKQTFLSSTPLDLSYSFRLEDIAGEKLSKKLDRPLHTPASVSFSEKRMTLMKQVQKKDVLFSYPFENMTPFLEMLRQAAEDPLVLSIKITLYRIDVQSKLAEALIRAAENGKEVIVLMELRARFDEANNIEWSHRLDEAGCQVIYGPPGYKVHSKICLITRKDFGKIQYITQVGTGNYNEKTVKLYTDLSLVTSNQEIGQDASLFFHKLLLGNMDGDYSHLWVAPHSLKKHIIQSIEKERRKAEEGETGQIIIKCNSLTDREIMLKLIEASQSGVKVAMIIRGICCLVPLIPGFTENITVISVVGRFLEHSRIFCFGVGDERKLYISSADLMTRNTEHRVEIACPVLEEDLKQRVYDMLETLLMDNTKAWEQFSDGRYVLRHPFTDMIINSQEMFIDEARVRSLQVLSESEKISNDAEFSSAVKHMVQNIIKSMQSAARFLVKHFWNLVGKGQALFSKLRNK